MILMEIYLIRHGQTEWNRERRVQGASDLSELSGEGRRQIGLLKRHLAGTRFDQAYSSPLRRALETAREVLGEGAEIHVVEGLRERSFGEIEGKLWSEFEKEWPEANQRYRTDKEFPGVKGAESVKDIKARAFRVIKDIADKAESDRIAVFTHGSFIRFFLSNLSERGYDELTHENCEYAVVCYDKKEGRFRVVSIRNRGHLKGL